MQRRISDKPERTMKATKIYKDRASAIKDAKRIFEKFKLLTYGIAWTDRCTKREEKDRYSVSVLCMVEKGDLVQGRITFDFEVAQFSPVVTFSAEVTSVHPKIWGSTSKISRDMRNLFILEFGGSGFIDRIQHSETPVPLYVVNGHVAKEMPIVFNSRSR